MSESVERQRQIYDNYYSEYNHPAAILEQRMHVHLIRFLKRVLPPSGRVLDVGCGIGTICHALAVSGRTTVGIDLSSSAIARAKKHPSASYQQAALEEYQSDTPFDAVMMFDVVEHLDNPVRSLKHLSSLLRPGGQLIVSTPNIKCLVRRLKSMLGRPTDMSPCHEIEYDQPLLSDCLASAGFTVERFSGQLLGPRWLLRPAFLNDISIQAGSLAPSLAQAMIACARKA